MRFSIFHRLSVLLAIAALASCGAPKNIGDNNDTTPPVGTGAKQTKQVSAAQGGEVAVEGAKLTVPPGAVAADTEITVTSSTEPAPETYKPLSPLYKFEPEGLEFTQPAEISLPAPATGADKAVIYWSKKGAAGYDVLATTVVGSELHAFVTHFSSGFAGEAEAASSNGASVVTTCSVPSLSADCAGCSISCSGDTQAFCMGAGAKNCDPNGGNCTTTCAAPTCECRPIPHTCSVPANDACHQAGCSVNCSGDTPLALCSQSAKTDAADAGTPNSGGGSGSGSGGSGTGTCVCSDGTPCDAQGACSSSCGPAPVCQCVSLANTGGTSNPGADGGIPTQSKCTSDADCPSGATCTSGVCSGGGSTDPGCGPNQPCTDGGSTGGSGSCATNGDCASGMICVSHVCQKDGPNSGGSDGGTAPPPCTADSQCPMGYRCLSGACQPAPCTGNGDCAAGMMCVNGHCEPGSGTCAPGTTCPDGSLCRADGTCGGASTVCTADSDCGPGGMCMGGKCTVAQCSATMPCPSGMTCVGGMCQGGATTDGGTPPPPGGCTTDAECGPDGVCLSGKCTLAQCSANRPCPSGMTCQNGTCQGGTATDGGTPPPPGSCTADADCGPDMACIGGKCTMAQCSATRPCPSGMACVGGTCQPTSGGADGGTATQCAPGTPCPDGSTCSPSGTCGGSGTTRPVGAPCSSTMPCGGTELCLTSTSGGASYCTVSCADSATCSPYGMICGTSGGAQVCLRPTPCGAGGTCPSGMTCGADGMCK